MTNATYGIPPMPHPYGEAATLARDLVKRALAPFHLTGRAIGGMAEANANGCGIFCFLLGDVGVGWLMTPAGENDWFFGDIHVFGSVGGAILGPTPGPDEPLEYLALDRRAGWQYALGVSAGFGVSLAGFVTEATTREAFSEFARNAGFSAGPLRGYRSENTAGQVTHGLGVGFSPQGSSWVGGVNIFNSYTVVSPGVWPSWLAPIPYR